MDSAQRCYHLVAINAGIWSVVQGREADNEDRLIRGREEKTFINAYSGIGFSN